MPRQNILVLSSHTRPEMSAPINHRLYCDRWGFDYLFDASPFALKSPFDQKTLSVLTNLKRSKADWIFWIDDDAYFMDFEKDLCDFIDGADDVDFIFCRSPVNPKGQWSIINAGIYFIRNSENAIHMLEAIYAAPDDLVRDHWDADRHGMYTIDGSDQEKFIYIFETMNLMDRVQILPHVAFNARHYDFERQFDEHFICHLASHSDKSVPLNDMMTRFALDRYLRPTTALATDYSAFRYAVFHGPKPVKRKPSLVRRGLRKARHLI